MVRQRQGRIKAWVIRVAGADPVRHNHAIACVNERPDKVAVEKPPGRVAVQQQHRTCCRQPGVDVRQSPAVDPEHALLPWEEALQPEGFGWCHRVLGSCTRLRLRTLQEYLGY